MGSISSHPRIPAKQDYIPFVEKKPREEIKPDTMLDHRAWVVFMPIEDVPILRIFHYNFRHCFVIAYDGASWYVIDPRGSFMDVEPIHDQIDPDKMMNWHRTEGRIIIEAKIERHPDARLAFGIYSCVAVIKRYLGIRNRWILTPHQLFGYLYERAI